MESNRYEDRPIRQIEADKAWFWGIAMGLVIGVPAFYNPKQNVSAINPAHFERIDRDEIADLVDANGNIFLASETEEGLVYKSLTPSDIYRIR